jgi:hypothetical protein
MCGDGVGFIFPMIKVMNIFWAIPALGVAIILLWMFAIIRSLSKEWGLLQSRLQAFFQTKPTDID